MLVWIGLGAWSVSHSETTQPPPSLDSRVVSISINGTDYTFTSAPFTVPANNAFVLAVQMENTGTVQWGGDRSVGQYGATLLSRNPDNNTTFGTFLISLGQGTHAGPGATDTFRAGLRAPSTPGHYTMTWRLADWIIPDEQYGGLNHADAMAYGDTVTVEVSVTDPLPIPNAAPHQPEVLDINDLTYVGSFTLPDVPGAVGGDEKAFYESGIALRTVNGEKRLLLATGTYDQTLYEVAVPGVLGSIVGSDFSAVTSAELRTVFGRLPNVAVDYAVNGSMWYDQTTGLFYWGNYSWYYPGPIPMDFPLLQAGRLDNGVLTPERAWYQPALTVPGQQKAFWGGVTGIPQRFADQYTGGRTLGIGFGGNFSINAACSWGPAIAAASVGLASGANLDLLPIMNSSLDHRAVRDGNYLIADLNHYAPTPWAGEWTSNDTIRTGVFIDLPDKKGYVTFARQGIERINYDWAGPTWNAKDQNTWYFYDLDTLGQAALGKITTLDVEPSSFSTVNLPYGPTSANQRITGSAFDAATRLLYVYTLWVKNPGGLYNLPAIHVYRVSQDLAYDTASVTKTVGDAPFTNPLTMDDGDVVTYTSSNPSVATVDATTGKVTIVAKGATTITASAPAKTSGPTASYTLIVTLTPITYTVTASADSNGTISPSGTVSVSAGNTWSFRVAPNAGYNLASMGGSCGGSLNGNLYTINPITANCTVTAIFAPAGGPTVTLTQITPSGSASPAAGVAVSVGASGSTTFTITPPAGANYASWAGMSGGCGSIALASTWYLGSNLVLKVGPVTSNCTFPVAFKVKTTTSTVTLTQITPSGSASPAAGTAVPVSANGFTTFTLTPPAGVNYASWAGVSGGCGAIVPASTWYVGSNLVLKVGPVTRNCTFPIAFSSR